MSSRKDPARNAMVTIGTDGFVDYVQMADGEKFTLGPVSVLRLITSVAPTRVAKQALDEFLHERKVMLSVDLDRMWSLMPFRRARFSSANPFMNGSDRELRHEPMRIASYDTYTEHVDLAEEIVRKVTATNVKIDTLVQSGKRFDVARARQDLHRIASRVTEIARDVDMAQPWVRDDLIELHKRASYMTYLFSADEPW